MIASLIAASAYPNGRQPPRPSDTSPVKATCEERSGGKRHEILRARIATGDESTDRLNVLIDNTSERVAIADIKTLTLPSARVDLDGKMKATLVRGDDPEKRSVMVEVRSGKANLRLAGLRMTVLASALICPGARRSSSLLVREAMAIPVTGRLRKSRCWVGKPPPQHSATAD